MNNFITFSDAQTYLIEYCNEHLQNAQMEKTQYRYICPFCNSGAIRKRTSAFRIIKRDLRHYKCDSCGAYGDLFNLIEELEHTSFKEAINIFQNEYGLEVDLTTIDAPRETQPIAEAQQNKADTPKRNVDKELNKYYLENIKENQNNLFEEENEKYLKHLILQRGLTEETILMYALGLKYEALGSYKKKYIYIPFFDNIAYMLYSPFASEEQPKYIMQPKGTTNMLYNTKAFEQHNPIFVCEGIFDALSIIQSGYEAIALCGSGNAHLFVETVLKENIQNPFILFLDYEADKNKQKLINETKQFIYEALNGHNILVFNNACEILSTSNKTWVKDANELLTNKKFKNYFLKSIESNFKFAVKQDNSTKVKYAMNKPKN